MIRLVRYLRYFMVRFLRYLRYFMVRLVRYLNYFMVLKYDCCHAYQRTSNNLIHCFSKNFYFL